MAYVNHLLTFIESNPALAVGFNLILLLLSGIFAHLLCKFLLIKVVRKVFFSSHKQDVPLEKDRRIAEKLSNFIPVIIVYYVLQFMPAMPASLVTAINTICGILFFIFMSVFFNEMLDIVNSSYLRKTKRKNHSIKGYIQIGKILVHIGGDYDPRRDVEQIADHYYLQHGGRGGGTDDRVPAYSAVAGGERSAVVQRRAPAGGLD